MCFAEYVSTITFYPFIVDAERGAAAGAPITSQMNPYFALNTLKSSQIIIGTL